MGFLIITIIAILMIIVPIILVCTHVIAEDSILLVLSFIGALMAVIFGVVTLGTYCETTRSINEIAEYRYFIDNAKDTETSQAVLDAKRFDANQKIAELKAARKAYPIFCFYNKEVDALEYFK